MFCPKCSQQQVSDDARFCSRCGFLLEGVTQLLAADGMLPVLAAPSGEKGPPSPRLKGVRQGGKIMLSGLLIVPLLAIMSEEARIFSDAVPATAALICFLGGFVRMLYALLFQDGPLRRTRQPLVAPPLFAPAPTIPPPAGLWEQTRGAALPPVGASPRNVAQRIATAEIYQPASVTEHTTKLLRDDQTAPQERRT